MSSAYKQQQNMKKTIPIIILIALILSVGCQENNQISDYADCIEYIDSLEINLENNKLSVALIDLAQENDICFYSILYDNCLIVVNKKKSFYVFQINCLKRDTMYEKKLNTRKFEKAFVAFDELHGIDHNNQVFRFDSKTNEWIGLSYNLPFSNSIPIFENEKYLCYSYHLDYKRGGILFFYNKKTKRITFVPATYAVSVIETQFDEFYIVCCFEDVSAHSKIIKINNPDSLYELPDSMYVNNNLLEEFEWVSVWIIKSDEHPDCLSDDKWEGNFFYNSKLYHDSTLFNHHFFHIYETSQQSFSSGFRIKEELYYLTEIFVESESKLQIFLTKFAEDSLIFINTADEIFSHLPISCGEITRKINNKTIADYIIRDNLLATFLITDSTLVKINWKK